MGFIRDLPKDLVAAFRATLEELRDADLLLHVVDAADPRPRAADRRGRAHPRTTSASGETPRLLVFNKVDLLPAEDRVRLLHDPRIVAVAANDGQTTGPLLSAIQAALWREGHVV